MLSTKLWTRGQAKNRVFFSPIGKGGLFPGEEEGAFSGYFIFMIMIIMSHEIRVLQLAHPLGLHYF